MSKMLYKPTGIIRTIPAGEAANKFSAYREFYRSIWAVERGAADQILIALPQLPIYEVLHIYLLIAGRVRVRLNIAEYVQGDSRECWDKVIRRPKYWAIATAPVSRPPSPIVMRGFQGFRYTNNLW